MTFAFEQQARVRSPTVVPPREHPVPSSRRGQFSERLGAPVHDVRVVSPAVAATVSGRGADAVSLRGGIAFGEAPHQPGSGWGQGPLTHELTDIVRKRGGITAPRTTLISASERRDAKRTMDAAAFLQMKDPTDSASSIPPGAPSPSASSVLDGFGAHSGAPLQAKLLVGEVNDTLEREADCVADRVVGMPDARVRPADATPGAHSEQDTREDGVGRLLIEPSGMQAAAGEVPAAVAVPLRVAGRPLDIETRSFMEARFGYDFCSVRVHSGLEAARAAQILGAAAFTFGNDLAFGAGYFAPTTPAGRRLIAHELTHVLQQRRVPPIIQRDPVGDYSSTDPVVDVKWVVKPEGDAWQLTVDGDFTTPEGIGRMIWPGRRRTPPGVSIRPRLVMQASAQWTGKKWKAEQTTAIFELTGVTLWTMETMDPLFARKFAEAGLRKEPESVEDARARYRAAHLGSGNLVQNRLVGRLSAQDLAQIDAALRRVTWNNPDLLEAYYRFNTEWKLTDDLEGKELGKTDKTMGSGGYTKLNSDVLHRRRNPDLPTDDTLSLLGATLIHEYVHTAHASDYYAGPGEGKAYGIENFFNERLVDTKRDAKTLLLGPKKGDKTAFDASYRVMKLLYEVIDGRPTTSSSLKGVTPQRARELSVEFISKNKGDFGKELRKLVGEETGTAGFASLPSQEVH